MVVDERVTERMAKTSDEERGTTNPTYRCNVCGKVCETPEALADHIYSVGLVY